VSVSSEILMISVNRNASFQFFDEVENDVDAGLRRRR
jgi:hypothetical protein